LVVEFVHEVRLFIGGRIEEQRDGPLASTHQWRFEFNNPIPRVDFPVWGVDTRHDRAKVKPLCRRIRRHDDG